MYRTLLDGTGWPVAERQGLAMVWIGHDMWKRFGVVIVGMLREVKERLQ